MITSLRLVNFKNFADETLRVGPVTVIVGANASGKSNVRDAFRLLHGIGRGYTLAEIMGGKLGTGGERVWSPIRGAPREIVRLESSADLSVGYPMRHTIVQGGDFDPRAGLALEVAVNVPEHVRYAISVHPDNARPDFFRVGVEQLQRSRDSRIFQNPGVTPVLTQCKKWNEPYRACAENVAGVLASMRFFDPTPRFMREPAFPGQSFGDSGENLAAALHEICTDPQRMETFAEWIGELTPMDVRGLEFPSDPSGRLHLVIRDANDREVSAYAASDGTLRFLAMLAALLGDTRTGLYFFEEIDNGIHPSRLWLLLELIEQRTASRQPVRPALRDVRRPGRAGGVPVGGAERQRSTLRLARHPAQRLRRPARAVLRRAGSSAATCACPPGSRRVRAGSASGPNACTHILLLCE